MTYNMLSFLTVKQEKNKSILEFNVKGAPCLSDKLYVQVATHVVMKSLVASLQEKYNHITITFVKSPSQPLRNNWKT